MAAVASASTETRSGTGSAHEATGDDLRRLDEYPYVVVSWVDDGFPTSVATSLEADPDAGVARLAAPAGMPIPDDREVSVVGSHIHPTRGGYDERRYLQLWGRVSEGVQFAPTRAWGWDEAEMPFFEYSERSVPQSRRYLTALSAEKGRTIRPRLSLFWLALRTTRLPFLSATAVPVLLGIAVAASHGALRVVDRPADPHRRVVRSPGHQRHERHLRHALRCRRRESHADAILGRLPGGDLRPRLGSRAGAAGGRSLCRCGRHRPGARGRDRIDDPVVDRRCRHRARGSRTPRRP